MDWPMVNTAILGDLRCVECQGPVTSIAPVVSDPEPVSWGICVPQDGPVVLGWTTSCGHYVDATDWEFFSGIGPDDVPYVRFEPRQAVT